MKNQDDENLRVIFKLDDKHFSLHSGYVEAMEVINGFRVVPNSPKYLRGIIELRGNIIPLIDLRIFLGMPTLKDQYNKLEQKLKQFEQEHLLLQKEYNDNFDSSSKKYDNNLCKMEKFIADFQSENIFFNEAILELKFPHKKLHETLAESYKYSTRTLSSIEEKKYLHLKQQITLKEFPRFISKIQNSIKIFETKMNELYIVLGYDGRLIAITVDMINFVENVSSLEKQKTGLYDFFHPNMQTLIESVGRNDRIDGVITNLSAIEFFRVFKFDQSINK